MTKVAKAKPKKRLNGTSKGKITKKSKKLSALDGKKATRPNGRSKKGNGKTKSRINDDLDEISKVEFKKKPSKAELKLLVEHLNKDPKLLFIRKALKYIPHYLKSEGLTKKLLKVVIKLWAEAGEKVRVVCLLCLIRLYTKMKEKEKKQLVIKQLYNTFLDKCRITKLETMSMIGFMRHSLIELYKIDPDIAFAQAQTSCQQLTLTLKNAFNHKNEETYKTVLNWQFANCLILLSNLIISQDDESRIRSLTHQVIQLNLGALNFLSSPRYYPFYCHIIENLINLSSSSKLFIPVLPHILSILDKIQLTKALKEEAKNKNKTKAKPKSKSDGKEEDVEEKEPKEYNMDILNHVSLDEAHCFDYNVAVLDKLHELLKRYLASQCHKIAFPELVLLPSVQLKKWLKRNPDKHTEKFKTLLDKMKADCEKIEQARQTADFSISDNNAVDAWEKRMRDSNKLSLAKLNEI